MWFPQMPGNLNSLPGVEVALQGPLPFFPNHDLKFKKKWTGEALKDIKNNPTNNFLLFL